MNLRFPVSSRCFKGLVVAGAILLPVVASFGDVIHLKGLDRKGTILKIAKGEGDAEFLYWTSENGSPGNKPLDQVVQIEADGEAALTAAEAEYVAKNYKAANDDYRKALSSTKDWVKIRANERLLIISAQIGDFKGSVAGFVEMAKKDPTGAAAHKPVLTGVKPEDLKAAIIIVKTGLAGAKTETKQLLLPFEAQMLTAAGDPDGAAKALADLRGSGSAAAGVPGTPDAAPSAASSDLRDADADVAIANARKALTAQKYDDVLNAINTHSASFTNPAKQVQAMYLMAEAKNAHATTPEALEEAALAYIRVVAHFKALPDAPVADALYKTGVIEEKLKKNAEAMAIYKQIIAEYKDSKSAPEAQAALTRLEGGK